MASSASGATQALIVDDEPFNRALLEASLRPVGFECTPAHDGQHAWELLDKDPDRFDVVLLDRMMPRMDGMELLGRIKADRRLQAIPVIMQTALTSDEDVASGIEAGVFYYLPKPLDRRLLISVMQAAVEGRGRFRRLQEDLAKRSTAFILMESGTFRFTTPEEGRTLAVALARVSPNSRSLVVGLSEMFTNAVEHGNLGLTFEDKARLLAENRWVAEVEARLALPENQAKRVTVEFERGPDQVRFTIRDEGGGFDWRRFVDFDPSRAFHTHGRGIVMARRISFDHVDYRDPGSEVVCTVRTGDAGDTPSASLSAQAPSAEEVRIIGDDLRSAREMQNELLPSAEYTAMIESRSGVRLTGLLETSSALGGDMWGLEPLDGRRFAVYVADFSGHDYSAALNTFRLHTLVRHTTEHRDQPAAYLSALNRHLCDLLPVGQYATMLYGVVDPDRRCFTYAAAAVPHPLAVRTPTGEVTVGMGNGLPLGVVATAVHAERYLPFEPGTLLFLHSDALNEAPLRDGPALGSKGVARMVGEEVANGAADAGAIIRPFLAAVRRPLHDDLTAVSCFLPG